VDPGAILGGTGVIYGDVNNYGMLLPGVDGTALQDIINGVRPVLGMQAIEYYWQDQSASMWFFIQQDSPLDINRLSVLEGRLAGDLVPVVLERLPVGPYAPEVVVQSAFDGALDGTQFDRVIDDYFMYDFQAIYGTNGMGDYVALGVERLPYQSWVRTYNQRQIAHSLDQVVGFPDKEGGLAYLLDVLDKGDGKIGVGQGDVDALCYALDRLNPEQYHGIEDIVFGGAQNLMGQMFQNFRTMNYGLPGHNVAAMFQGSPGATYADASASNPTGSAQSAAMLDADRRLNLIVFGYGHMADIDSEMSGPDILRTGLEWTSVGGMVGFDYRVCDSINLGVIGGAGVTDGEWDMDRGDVDATSVWVGPYFSFADEGVFVDASVLFSRHWFDTTRNVLFPDPLDLDDGMWHEVMKADVDVDSISAYVGAGYMFKTGNWSLGPIGSAQYTWAGIDAFKEKGGDAALELKDRDMDSLRTLLGARFAYDASFDWGHLIPEFRARWAYEALERRGELSARFINSGAPVFKNRMEELSQHSAYLGAGLNALINKRVSVYANYDADIGGDQTTHSARVGVSVKF
jgi:uncharacterized protein YhjY with autotransporter beta-barrel domain